MLDVVVRIMVGRNVITEARVLVQVWIKQVEILYYLGSDGDSFGKIICMT